MAMSDKKNVCSGWGNGFNTATTPLWVSELIPAKSRGRHVSIEANLIAFGIVFAYYFNIGMSYTSGALQWRTPIAFQGIFIIAQFVWIWFLPESPRWLTKRTLPGISLFPHLLTFCPNDRREQMVIILRLPMPSGRF